MASKRRGRFTLRRTPMPRIFDYEHFYRRRCFKIQKQSHFKLSFVLRLLQTQILYFGKCQKFCSVWQRSDFEAVYAGPRFDGLPGKVQILKFLKNFVLFKTVGKFLGWLFRHILHFYEIFWLFSFRWKQGSLYSHFFFCVYVRQLLIKNR